MWLAGPICERNKDKNVLEARFSYWFGLGSFELNRFSNSIKAHFSGFFILHNVSNSCLSSLRFLSERSRRRTAKLGLRRHMVWPETKEDLGKNNRGEDGLTRVVQILREGRWVFAFSLLFISRFSLVFVNCMLRFH